MKEAYRRNDREQPQENENQLEGRNALTEALRSGRTIDKVFIAAGETDRGLQHLAAQAKEAGAVVVPVDRRKLNAMPPGNTPVLTISCKPPLTGEKHP